MAKTRKNILIYVAGGILISLIGVGLTAMRSCNIYSLDGFLQKKYPGNIHPVIAFPHLSFEQPVDLQSAPDGSRRLFVVQQKGVISAFLNSPQTEESMVFLDIRDRVFSGHMEEGLLGLTFHPNFKTNGSFYVYYSANNPRRSVISRFQVPRPDLDKADRTSERIILEVPQPYGNHNGGQLAFGPDGYLYIGLGDGGSAGDPHGHGQNRATLLGSILRIDVDRVPVGRTYGIPKDNPFAGNTQGFREEIFAYGLRNPWRFSFDSVTGWLWAGDVGQDKPIEEVNVIEKGKNYGWNIMEGRSCYNPPTGCDPTGTEKPVWEYSMDKGRSITGGYVYRGKALPELQGRYVYADFMSGRIWALSYDGKHPTYNKMIHQDPALYIASFGIDQDRELYFCSFNGRIYKLAYKDSKT